MDACHGIRIKDVASTRAGYVSNSQFVAFPCQDGIHIQSLQHQDRHFHLSYNTGRPAFTSELAFSPTRLNLLAAANASCVHVFNVSKRKTRCILKGNGRVVTSISFSERQHEVLVTGAVDGSICVWSIKQPSRPLYQLQGLKGAARFVALHSLHSGVLAGLCHKGISIWSLLHSKTIATTSVMDCDLAFFAWRSSDTISAISRNGKLLVLKFHILQGSHRTPQRPVAELNVVDQKDETLGLDHGAQATITCLQLAPSVQQAEPLGDNGFVILPVQSDTIYFYSYPLEESSSTELWRLQLDSALECFALRFSDISVDIVATASNCLQSYVVPTPVLDAMNWSRSKTWTTGNPAYLGKRFAADKMLPTKVERRKTVHKPGSDKVVQLPANRKVTETPSRVSRKSVELNMKRPETPTPQSMIPRLESPKDRWHEDDQDSPMPFLSPFIPARNVSPGPMTPLDEHIRLPPRVSLDSTASIATRGHDSDSDDETFAGALRYSGSFLPGGVNVPLPRTCGATFGPNGQLLIFLPFQPRPGSAKNVMNTAIQLPGQSTEMSKLFPSFGHFRFITSGTGPELENLGNLDKQVPDLPMFNFQPSSLSKRPSWSARHSPMNASGGGLPGPNKVSVSVCDVEGLTPTRQALATLYNVYAEDSKTAIELSLANARVAASIGMYQTEKAWHLLAMILEQVSMTPTSGCGEIRTHLVRRSSHILGDRSLTQTGSSSQANIAGISRSQLHPLGKSWAIDQLFAWVEEQADVQLAACMSVLLMRAIQLPERELNRFQHKIALAKGVRGNAAELNSTALDPTMLPPGVPILRANNSTLETSDDLPLKRQASQNSSRNTSQPTTPYLEFFASTPPLTLPTLSRHSSRLSHSGSTSPEHHRSSFSIAAKSYAASIAEKFASYGSSPPARKFGDSPSNELSTSLPTAAANGSWSKSVSFASTLDGGRTSNSSLSIAQEDDNYDSDRTIDDSLPHTPKNPTIGVSFRIKNENLFNRYSDDGTGELVSTNFAERSALWRQCYAEHLRSWNLLHEAAEIESYSGLGPERESRYRFPENAVVCQSAGPGSHATCMVCYCAIHASRQLCPACLHTTHPDCLESFISSLGSVSFTCPTGCGCDCASQSNLEFMFDEAVAATEPVATKRPKRPSLTNPLRLRQRLQGESW